MTRDKLNAAKGSAKRFLAACKELEDRTEAEPNYTGLATGTRESAAVRRASMDLTRALAGLRRYS